MSDLIYRQEAIDALREEFKKSPTTAIRAMSVINGLPVAESEIIRCKDCDWWTKQEASLQGRCARHGAYPTGEWFCAGAKRRKE